MLRTEVLLRAKVRTMSYFLCRFLAKLSFVLLGATQVYKQPVHCRKCWTENSNHVQPPWSHNTVHEFTVHPDSKRNTRKTRSQHSSSWKRQKVDLPIIVTQSFNEHEFILSLLVLRFISRSVELFWQLEFVSTSFGCNDVCEELYSTTY